MPEESTASQVNMGPSETAWERHHTELEALRLAVESLPAGALVIRPDGRIAIVNRQLEQLFGYRREELVGQPVGEVLPGGLPDLPSTRPGASRRAALRRDGSQFPIEIGLSTIATEHGTFVIAAVVGVAAQPPSDDATTEAIDDETEFERLIAELSVQFINLPGDRVEAAIRDALQRIGEGLDLDRCDFRKIQPDGLLLEPVSWVRAGFPDAPALVGGPVSFPWAYETIRTGKMVCFSSVDEVPNATDRDNFRSLGIHALIAVPLLVEGQLLGVVGFQRLREAPPWRPEAIHRLGVIAAAFGNVLARQKGDEALQAALAEVQRLRDQLQAENLYLRREVVKERFGSGIIVGQTAAVRRVLALVEQVAPTDSTVLLLGETGTGKELFATQIHELSTRRGRSVVRVNCAAIPATLIESELFGREKGAFTDALSRQIGRFELADHSTIFLDEIGDLPLDVQVKLLRVLEERQIERLGSAKGIRVDTRVIAATHRDLEQRIAEGAFREDLFYRLNVFPIQVPPLRERVEDIPLLVLRFVDEFAKSFGKRIEAIPRENMAALQQYSWPGNIRELRNVVERAMILATGPRLTIVLPSAAAPAGKPSSKLVDVEREHIRAVLESVAWRIRGVGGAADRLGLPPTTLETRMAKLGITRPKA